MREGHRNSKMCPITKTCLKRSGLPGVLVVLRRDPLKVDASAPDERPLLDSQPASVQCKTSRHAYQTRHNWPQVGACGADLACRLVTHGRRSAQQVVLPTTSTASGCAALTAQTHGTQGLGHAQQRIL